MTAPSRFIHCHLSWFPRLILLQVLVFSVIALADILAFASDEIKPAPPLNTAREGHTATPLKDGRVLVAGGRNEAGDLASTEIFDAVTGKWTVTASLNTARSGHIAVLLKNGTVLIAGGRDSNGAGLDSAEVYDPAAGVWTAAAAMTTPRMHHAASLMPSGLVMVSGGMVSELASEALDSTETFDPVSGLWTAAGVLNHARAHHASAVQGESVVILGGISGNIYEGTSERYDGTGLWSVISPWSGVSPDQLRKLCTTIQRYDSTLLVTGGIKTATLKTAGIFNDSWSTTAPMLAARSEHAAAKLPDDRVLITGGLDQNGTPLSASEVFANSQWVASPSLGTARARHTATELPGGLVLIAGGQGSGGALASCEIFIPAPAPLVDVAPMGTSRQRHTATLLPDGKVLVVGGETRWREMLASAEIYNPQQNTWTPTNPLSSAHSSHTATLLADGRIMISGGGTWSRTPIGTTEVFDPANNTWRASGNMVQPRYRHASVLLPDGRVLVAGGLGSEEERLGIRSAELYDPVSGVWTATSPMLGQGGIIAATLLKNGKVLVVNSDIGFYSAPSSSQLYDPLSGVWSSTGPLTHHYASDSPLATFALNLLPDGRVLVAGGDSRGQNPGNCEIYDPVTNTWSVGEAMLTAGENRRGTLLADGRVMVTGDESRNQGELYNPLTGAWAAFDCLSNNDYQATVLLSGRVLITGGDLLNSRARIFDPCFRSSSTPRPVISSAFWDLSGRLVLQGRGFAGNPDGSPPTVIYRRLDNGQTENLLPDDGVGWTENEFTSQTVSSIPEGYSTVILMVNGVQAEAAVLSRNAPEITVEQPEGRILGQNSTAAFGIPATGGSAELQFTIRNRGLRDLAGLALSLNGQDASSFSISPTPPIVLAGPAGSATFTIWFTPANPGPKTAVLRIVSNDADEGQFEVMLTGTGVDSAPQISPVADQVMDEDTTTGPITFTVNDGETPDELVVTASSSNPALIPASGIVLTGSGSARAVALTPLPAASGSAVITLTVNDGALQSSTSFQLTVNAVNDPPTLGVITDPPVERENAGLRSIALTGVDSGEGAAQQVAISATSDNPGLFSILTAVDGWVRWQAAPDVSGQAVVTVTVNDGQGAANSTVSRSFTVKMLPTIRGEAAQVTEGNGDGTMMAFRIFIHSPQPEPVSVDYATDTAAAGAGRAQPGSDFLAVSGKLVIPAGATEAVINIGITGDTVFENDEELKLLVSNPQNAFLTAGDPFVLTGLILNDDPQPTLTVTAGSVTEAPVGGPFQVWISATLSAPSTLPLTWTVHSRSGTAQAGSDFDPLGPVALTFAPGQTSKWVAIKVNGSGSSGGLEGDEEFYIDFTPVGGPAAAVTSTATIRQLAIREFYPLGTGLFALRFPTGNGQTYLIDEAASLSGPWIENSALILGSGSQVTQVVFSSKRKSFFRVRAASLPPGTADVGP